MVLDPHAERLLDMLRVTGPLAPLRLDTAARRDGLAKLMQLGGKPMPVARSADMAIGGPGGPLALRLYDAVPHRKAAAPALVFCHGGGLVAGSLETHDGICRGLANASGAVVISVDYRLAPEHKFPAGLVDAAFAVDWVARHAASVGIDPARLAIGGESAGALLAALIGNGYHTIATPLKAQLLLCPVLDLTGALPSRAAYGRGYLIDETIVQRDIADCLAEGARPETLPSPLRAGKPELSPPTIIVSAECDPFRDEAKHYGELLEGAGVPVWHTCHAGMIHSFYGLSAFLPGAGPALQAAGQQLRALLC